MTKYFQGIEKFKNEHNAFEVDITPYKENV